LRAAIFLGLVAVAIFALIACNLVWFGLVVALSLAVTFLTFAIALTNLALAYFNCFLRAALAFGVFAKVNFFLS
jgi:hypothetical protein